MKKYSQNITFSRTISGRHLPVVAESSEVVAPPTLQSVHGSSGHAHPSAANWVVSCDVIGFDKKQQKEIKVDIKCGRITKGGGYFVKKKEDGFLSFKKICKLGLFCKIKRIFYPTKVKIWFFYRSAFTRPPSKWLSLIAACSRPL